MRVFWVPVRVKSLPVGMKSSPVRVKSLPVRMKWLAVKVKPWRCGLKSRLGRCEGRSDVLKGWPSALKG